MNKSTIIKIQLLKQGLSISLTFFAVKVIDTVHLMCNCEQSTSLVSFFIPQHFFSL